MFYLETSKKSLDNVNDSGDALTDRQTDSCADCTAESSSGAKCNGVMGVPITFLDKYNPDQFEILGIANSARYVGNFPCYTIINGKKIYNRILIRRKNNENRNA